jgi:hypothetical protein
VSAIDRGKILQFLRLPHGQLLCVLLITDFSFFALHICHSIVGIPSDGAVAISRPRGFPETVQYVKFFWAALLFLLMWTRHHRLTYILFAGVFLYLLVDDACEIHESIGIWFEGKYPDLIFLGTTPEHIGEALALMGCGSVVLIALAIGYLRAPLSERALLRPGMWMLGIFAFFAFVVDTMHAPFYGDKWYIDRIFQFIEEGGEMISMSFILAYVLGLAAKPSVPAP